MSDLDSLYFEAISAAASGIVQKPVLIALHQAAAKYVILQLDADAARYYERIYQLWLTLRANQRKTTDAAVQSFLQRSLLEYCDLLERLNRQERAKQIKTNMPGT